ncbi:thioredoxin domain-containing protein [Novosphingopyxis iocasae]|uniref:thioredoxin domain-containing protein n=1 Tax=Novosphingopyxis iocasae TaxID=2762729 RepID=UPI00165138E1|nr:thioredoxin domain-containing protein [Novosphingopyxis iocasae]
MTIKNALATAPFALAIILAGCGNQDAPESEAKAATPAAAATGDSAVPSAKPTRAAGQEWSDVVVKTPEGGYAMGDPDAPVTLVEYGAVTCSHCAAFEQSAFAPMKKDYVDSGKVRFELRNFILSPFDIPITLLTQCEGPDRYYPLTEAVFGEQEALMQPAIQLSQSNPQALQDAMNAPLNERFYNLGKAMGVVDFFASRGVSEQKAKACLSDQSAIEQLVATTEKGVSDGVTGTPTFFLNGEKIQTDKWAEMKPRLDAALGAQ